MPTRVVLTVAMCAVVLWAAAAFAQPSPQDKCNAALITGWKLYVSCLEGAVAKEAKSVFINDFAVFTRCRSTYFKRWTHLQANPALATSTCQPADGLRLVDNMDGTITDNLTGLVWEKKDNLDNVVNLADPHDADNSYTWSTGSNKEDGTVFTNFLATLNGGGGFAGSNGWRLPTLAELQSILEYYQCSGSGDHFTCSCASNPCIAAIFGPTQFDFYWSAMTSHALFSGPESAWDVDFYFNQENIGADLKTRNNYVRAVRGGL